MNPRQPPIFMEVNAFKQNHPRKKKTPSHYSKGELNKLIDDVLHPLIDSSPELIMVDTVLHGLIEQNPSETTLKFIRYTLPKILKRSHHKQKKE
jgi:hypothetical protein